MEAVRTSETSVDNHFTRQYIPEDNSEHHTRRRENLKSHMVYDCRQFEKHWLRASEGQSPALVTLQKTTNIFTAVRTQQLTN
jgi:hypothetical protein